MGRILVFAMLFGLLLISAYVVIALRANEKTDAIVKILGPGKTPQQCEQRILPHYKRMEPTITRIAETLLENFNYVEVMPALENMNAFFVTERATGKQIKIDAEDIDFDPKLFERLNSSGYYGALRFAERDDNVVAFPNANCGVPLYEWMRLILGFGWSKDSARLPVAITAYIYNPNGIDEINPCPTSAVNPDPVLFCQIRLNENWLWALEYYDIKDAH